MEEEHDRVSAGRVSEYASLASFTDVGVRPALLPINPFVCYDALACTASGPRLKRAINVLGIYGSGGFHRLLGCAGCTKTQTGLLHGALNLKSAASYT